MFKCTVQMFGLPREITELREIEVDLKDGVGLGDVIYALRNKIPPLVGPVIHTSENRLVEQYKFNVNGRFYFGDTDLQIKRGDRIALLTPATGG